MMVALDESGGGLRWTVANDEPQVATADGGVIGKSGIVYDGQGMSTGRMAMAGLQSWRGNGYLTAGSVESIVNRPMFPDGASYWPQAGGNPSSNAVAYVQCPCLLQSARGTLASMPVETGPAGAAIAKQVQPVKSTAPLKTYVILERDPGLNLGPGHDHNVGNLFHLAAGTEQDALNARGNLAGSPKRVSSVQDFARELTSNGPITGGVVYFGHGRGWPYEDSTWSSALAPGEQQGPDTNITAHNVSLLQNAQIEPAATITLHACYAGLGSRRYSIAQLVANQLQRRVYASVAGTFFSMDPNARHSGGTAPRNLPNQKPIYQIQDFGTPFKCFLPGTMCQ